MLTKTARWIAESATIADIAHKAMMRPLTGQPLSCRDHTGLMEAIALSIKLAAELADLEPLCAQDIKLDLGYIQRAKRAAGEHAIRRYLLRGARNRAEAAFDHLIAGASDAERTEAAEAIKAVTA